MKKRRIFLVLVLIFILFSFAGCYKLSPNYDETLAQEKELIKSMEKQTGKYQIWKEKTLPAYDVYITFKTGNSFKDMVSLLNSEYSPEKYDKIKIVNLGEAVSNNVPPRKNLVLYYDENEAKFIPKSFDGSFTGYEGEFKEITELENADKLEEGLFYFGTTANKFDFSKEFEPYISRLSGLKRLWIGGTSVDCGFIDDLDELDSLRIDLRDDYNSLKISNTDFIKNSESLEYVTFEYQSISDEQIEEMEKLKSECEDKKISYLYEEKENDVIWEED